MSEEAEVHQVLLRMKREKLLRDGFRCRSGVVLRLTSCPTSGL
jgi:hypothetical protein